jgi:SAM-dependent methyltransferase
MSRLTVQAGLQDHYDAYYSSEALAKWRRLGAAGKADNIIRLCGPFAHERVIDIGCGDGAVLAKLDGSSFAKELYGLEISQSGLAALHRKQIRSLVEAMPFDGYTIAYPDRHFDLAVLSHVIEHVEHPRKLLYEASRIARYVFLEVPLEHTSRLSSDYTYDEVGHINFFTAKTIRRLAQTCHLDVLDQIVTDTSREMLRCQFGWKGTLRHALRRSALRAWPALAQRLFVYHCAVVCKSPEVASRDARSG